ncbi:MAG TPA: SIR2 family protein [Gaiellaceae bacterium]
MPFLGSGANLCGRTAAWKKPGNTLPSGTELALYLARQSFYPGKDPDNLVRVTQYQATMEGGGALYTLLRDVFVRDYGSTDLHRFLARLPRTLERLFDKPRYQLLITTNYDDALEQAYRDASQPFDLFKYIAWGENLGKFEFTPAGGKPELIKHPDTWVTPILEERPAILKIHGAIDRERSDGDSYVITEDHYIDFLLRTDVQDLLPASILPALQRTHFLFLGYGLADWNLRVILQRIWQQQNHDWSSWAVQHQTTPLELKFWTKRGVDIQVVDLLDYVHALDAALEQLATEDDEE